VTIATTQPEADAGLQQLDHLRGNERWRSCIHALSGVKRSYSTTRAGEQDEYTAAHSAVA